MALDTPQSLSTAPANPPEMEWWNASGKSLAQVQDLHLQSGVGECYTFCSCCGARVWGEKSKEGTWHKDYLHVGLRMTVEQFKEKLHVTGNPDIVAYEIYHNKVPFAFLWKDE